MMLRKFRLAFTLIELLVALVIASVLTLVALPAAREALRQHTVSRSAEIVRQVFLNARAQAIRTNRPFGVVVRRLSDTGTRADYGNQMSFAAAPPGYRGDFPAARARVYSITNPYQFQLDFPTAESARLYRDVQLYNSTSASPEERNKALLRDGAEIWLAEDFGPLRITGSEIVSGGTRLTVEYRWPLQPPLDQPLSVGNEFPFEIKGLPQESFLPDVEMPRDAIIDLSISGIGLQGLDFNHQAIRCANTATPGTNDGFDRVVIMFSPRGDVHSVLYEVWDNVSSGYRILSEKTIETIYLAVARADGVTSLEDVHAFDVAEDVRGELPNFASPETVWLTVRGNSGAVSVSPQPPAFEPRAAYYSSRGLTAPPTTTDCAARTAQLNILRQRVIDGRRLARVGSPLE